jgi:putative pyruvate formate lyase activating enzyme
LMEASYLKAHREGILKERADRLFLDLSDCTLCPRDCHADRLSGQVGTCKTGEYAMVSSYMPHFGEETPISGTRGSGTIFFTNCNLLCSFCQNYDISHEGRGRRVTSRELAEMMLSLQALGCHNINFVTPSHVVPQILQALMIAADDGLAIPLVYNSGGYDLVSTLKQLDGIFDIYMPDFKFWDPVMAQETCNAPDYPEKAKKAILEMHRQTGPLIINKHSGLAERGLLVRHLVMPERTAGTTEVMNYLAKEISEDTYVNIMPQYRPCGRAWESPTLRKSLQMYEFREAVNAALNAGLTRLDKI